MVANSLGNMKVSTPLVNFFRRIAFNRAAGAVRPLKGDYRNGAKVRRAGLYYVEERRVVSTQKTGARPSPIENYADSKDQEKPAQVWYLAG